MTYYNVHFTGALVLYSSKKSPLNISNSAISSVLENPRKLADILEKLGNVRRLMAAVLYLSDRDVSWTIQYYLTRIAVIAALVATSRITQI